jgi:hypothetical protein
MARGSLLLAAPITARYLGQLARDRNDLQHKLEAARANLARLTERQVADLFPRGPEKQAEGRALQTASAAAGNVCLVRVYLVGGILSRCPPPTLTPPLCRRLALMAQRADLADRRRAVGDRDRQIGEHPVPVMQRDEAPPGQRARQRPRSYGPGPPASGSPPTPHATRLRDRRP